LAQRDFYKLRKSKAFWICIFVSIGLAVLFVALLQTGVTNAEDVAGRGAAEMLAEVLVTGFNLIVIAAFVSIFITTEFQYGAMKNTLSRGAERDKVFFSKFIVSSCAALVILIAFILAFLATGSTLWGYDPNGIGVFSGLIAMVSLNALMVVAYTALFTFTSITLRGTASAIATNAGCLAIVSLLLGAVSALFSETFNLADYWIGWGVSNLATLTPASGDIVQGIIIALAWGVVSIMLGMTFFQRQDVK
jgi:ABC-type transport system involved in multi-copper enzyme maturation permease subunit